MPEQPLVSIIVPIYNAQDHIARCVESIRRQTYKNIEILLLNDGSQDVSLQVCEMYARVDDRIVLIDKANSGVAATRNLGLRQAKGKYLQFVDARIAPEVEDQLRDPLGAQRGQRPPRAPDQSADLRLFAGGCHDERGVCRRPDAGTGQLLLRCYVE